MHVCACARRACGHLLTEPPPLLMHSEALAVALAGPLAVSWASAESKDRGDLDPALVGSRGFAGIPKPLGFRVWV